MGSYAIDQPAPRRRVSVGSTPTTTGTSIPTRSVLDYAYCTPDYIMGTTELWPSDTHIAPSSQNRWQGVTFNTTSDARIYPQAALVEREPDERRVPLGAEQERLITEKRFYTNEPTLVYFPADLDSLVEHGGWIFVQEGASYLAVRPAAGSYRWLTPQKNKAANRSQRFIKLTNPTSPIIFEADRRPVPELRRLPAPHHRPTPHVRERRAPLHRDQHDEVHDVPGHVEDPAREQRRAELLAEERVQQPVHAVGVGLGQDHDPVRHADRDLRLQQAHCAGEGRYLITIGPADL